MTAATVNSNRGTMIGRPMGLTSRVAVLAACLLAGSLGVAQAAPAQDVPQVVVSYSDLNLASPDAVRELYKRIERAASEVCPYAGSVELNEVASNHACRNAAIARAVHEVNSAQLAALRADHVKRG